MTPAAIKRRLGVIAGQVERLDDRRRALLDERTALWVEGQREGVPVGTLAEASGVTHSAVSQVLKKERADG